MKTFQFFLLGIILLSGTAFFIPVARQAYLSPPPPPLPSFPPPGKIEFVGDAGMPQVFTFSKWEITKAEIPNDEVEKIKVELLIYISSLKTEWKELEENIRDKKSYFFVKRFPTATVVINGAEKTGNGAYKTNATLTLKGVSASVPLTFTMEGNKVAGKGTIKRSMFKFNGDGPKEEVPVTFEAQLPL